MTAIAVTIAGSDSGGGAGIQADLKTFSALGVYGASVITALTAQNTRGVTAIHDVPAAFVTAEIDAVFSDLAVGAVKIGMLSQPAVIEAVADGLRRHRQTKVVLDPVMVAASGDPLIADEAVAVGTRPGPPSRNSGTSCMIMMNTQRPIAVSMVAGRVRRTGVGLCARRSSDITDPSKMTSSKQTAERPEYLATPMKTIGHSLAAFKKNVSITMS